ncbi:TetR/AcrR family transcriptional regulator [Geodermatophilus sp. FMUSA9-8]|uniref:TetR/AcrR family transcriptional regulator n=1 Tax=Geodermatophilus sp. FMUSA9-8 TaxID=3120155 RepID=UPI00300AE053
MVEMHTPSRRARLRAQTLGEIKQQALEQLALGGPQAVSLNAIARSIGTTGPALYRYFASRDELIADLVADGFNELADALEQAAVGGGDGVGRMRAVAAAYRDWALAHPHRYRLLFASAYGSGRMAPEQTVAPSHRSMSVLLDAIGRINENENGWAPKGEDDAQATALDRQLGDWAQRRREDRGHSAETLQMGVLAWTRLHGIISLEIEGVFAAMGVDAALLYASEVTELTGRPRTPH